MHMTSAEGEAWLLGEGPCRVHRTQRRIMDCSLRAEVVVQAYIAAVAFPGEDSDEETYHCWVDHSLDLAAPHENMRFYDPLPAHHTMTCYAHHLGRCSTYCFHYAQI